MNVMNLGIPEVAQRPKLILPLSLWKTLITFFFVIFVAIPNTPRWNHLSCFEKESITKLFPVYNDKSLHWLSCHYHHHCCRSHHFCCHFNQYCCRSHHHQLGKPPRTMGEQWLLKQFSLNHPVEHIQKPKLPKLYVRVETSSSYFIIHNQFVKSF